MRWGLLVLGVTSLAGWALSGCSTPCTASNCTGCCDLSGQCHAASDQNCGINGATCNACVSPLSCISGSCQASDAGSTGSTGATLVIAAFDDGTPTGNGLDAGGGGGSITSYDCGAPGDSVTPPADGGFVLATGGYNSSSSGCAEISGAVVVDDATVQYLGCVGMTLDLQPNGHITANAQKQTFDLSQGGLFKHITFWAKYSGDATARIFVQLPTTGVDCSTNGCWGQLFTPTNSWTQYTIPLDPTQLSNLWGTSPPPPAYEPSKAVAIQWQVEGPANGSGTASYDLSVDQVVLTQ